MDEETSKYLESIAEHACNYYEKEVPKRGKPEITKNEWTTVAVIVQTRNKMSRKVVALGTGTKCLGRTELSAAGDLLSDSHAEVIARRCFLRYLYSEIYICLSNPELSVLIRDAAGCFAVKPDVQFHLFISHVPCGDAAIFFADVPSTKNDPETEVADPPPKKMRLDTSHRTGAKLVTSTVRYEDSQTEGLCRTKPGKGDPTLSMSCSDKIAKWMLLGLQGNLLGLLIPEEIRLASVIIGGSQPYSEVALRRAVYDRCMGKDKAQKPSLLLYQSKVNILYGTQNDKPAPASICGYLDSREGKLKLDVSVEGRRHGVTKKNYSKPAALTFICRKILAKLFLETVSKLDLKNLTIPASPSYRDLKCLNSIYRDRWRCIRENLMLDWTEKPSFTSEFSV